MIPFRFRLTPSASAVVHGYVALLDLVPEIAKQTCTGNLHHECASRLVEHRVPLSQVRDLLGHASIVTPERYVHQRPEALFEAAKRLEAGGSFKNLSSPGSDVFAKSSQTPLENDTKLLEKTDELRDWGG